MNDRTLTIEAASREDYAAILALNEAAIPAVNQIDVGELRALHAQAACLLVARQGNTLLGFLLVLDETADYESENYQYFRSHYEAFAYVDRIVVAAESRGLGLGGRLYDALDQELPEAPRVACEVNVRPPNPGSLTFHERLGFKVVDEQDTGGGAKRVALMIREQPATT
ncbi:MAG: GNAT family N-acetyltransferase [Pseudomonadota bacterium]